MMSVGTVRACGLAFVTVLVPLAIASGQPPKTNGKPAPEQVLPSGSVVQFRYDGTAAHDAAWKKTAAYKSLIGSEFYSEVKGWAVHFGGNMPFVQPVEHVIDHVLTHGMVVGAAIKPGEGQDPEQAIATVLIDGAALQNDVEALLRQAGATIGAPEKKGAYTVSSLMMGPGSNSAGLNLVTFGPHLAITSGSDDYLTRTANPVPARIASSLKANAGSAETIAATWLDVKQLRDAFGPLEIPVPPEAANPQPLKVAEILQILGADTVQQLVSHSGFNGSACWNSTKLEFTEPRDGLLTLWESPTFQLKDLPPLPENVPSFYAGSIDWFAVYSTYWEAVMTMAKRVGPKDAVAEIEDSYGQFQNDLGFQIQDLLTSLGPKHVVYADSANAFAGMGVGVCLEVKDAIQLNRVIETVLAKIPQGRGGPQIVRSKKYGRDLVSIGQQGVPMWPTFCIDKDWMIVALTPQMVESFLLRRDGKLDAWAPSKEVAESLKGLPKDMLSLTVSDPRPLIVAMGQYAPLLQSMMPPGVKALELPPSDLMTKPLFPNVSVCSVEDGVIHWQSRDSLPSLPGVGSLSGPSVGSSAVLVALLLPAVQQAREAARRTQSRNNLKQIGLALHNYHDTFNKFPTGTVVESANDVEDRLSWQVSILPYIEQAPLYNGFDMQKPFNKQVDDNSVTIRIPVYTNPSLPAARGFEMGGSTDYVGIAGLGVDGPKKKVGDKGAGAFAYDHPRSMRDITDGTSNTLGVGDVSGDRGFWARGGKSTIRAFTVKPYLKGPDGFAGAHVGGGHFLLLDGSVRFISDNIDANVLEALATIQGGEVIGQ